MGRAIVQLVGDLPFDLLWIDSRDEVFPPELPPNVRCEHSDPVQRAVADLAPGSQVLVMSFSHAEDLEIVAACLHRQRERGDLPFIGLIGSRSKWASFGHRLLARGFSILDIYAAMFTRWSLEPDWKLANIPKLMALAEAVSQRPAIAPVWQRHFNSR